MKISWKRMIMPAAAVCAAILCMGTEKCDPEEANDKLDELLQVETEPPKGAISIHEIVKYPRADETEQKIPSYFGGDVTIRRLPLLFYKEVESITAIQRASEPGFYDLKLKMTSRGRKMWIGLSVPNQRTPLAFVVDGMYYRSFKPRMIYDDTTDEVIVDGPFDQATALEIQNNSSKNHRKANK